MKKNKILKNYCGIYGYQNIITGKIHYIGQTIQSFKMRDLGHRRQKTNTICDNKLQAHSKEYEMIALLKFEIGVITNEELNFYEKELIKFFNTLHDNDEDCWNLQDGGKSYTVSETTKQKMSKSQKCRKITKEHKQKLSEVLKGRKFTKEHKQKLSEALKGRKFTKEHKQKLSETHKGNKLPEKTKKKMSEAHNTSGYYRVSKNKNSHYKQGFVWRYQYHENGKRKSISRVNIKDLEKEVKTRGLPWYKLKKEDKEDK